MTNTLYAAKDGTLYLAVTPAECARAFDGGYLPVVALDYQTQARPHLKTILDRFAIHIATSVDATGTLGVWHLKAALDGPLDIDTFFALTQDIRAFVAALPKDES